MSPSIVADMQIDVYHSIRMIATALATIVAQSIERRRGNRARTRFQSVIATLRKRSIMAVTCSGTSS
jgi:hypothetical protein